MNAPPPQLPPWVRPSARARLDAIGRHLYWYANMMVWPTWVRLAPKKARKKHHFHKLFRRANRVIVKAGARCFLVGNYIVFYHKHALEVLNTRLNLKIKMAADESGDQLSSKVRWKSPLLLENPAENISEEV